MTKLPEVSIIVPAYNEESFIEQCIRSVSEQKTKRPYEIIIVDNNSTDRTKEIVSKFNVKYVLEKKPGATVARNSGANLAKARILYFLDADCRLPQGQIEKICQTFLDNPRLNIVAGNYVYDKDGLLPYFVTGTLKYFYIYHKLIKLIFGINTFSSGNFAIKSSAFIKVGGFDETICNQEIVLPDDLNLAIRLHDVGIRDALFSSKYYVYSSFRRVKKSPVKHTWIRFVEACKILFRN